MWDRCGAEKLFGQTRHATGREVSVEEVERQCVEGRKEVDGLERAVGLHVQPHDRLAQVRWWCVSRCRGRGRAAVAGGEEDRAGVIGGKAHTRLPDAAA